MICFKTNEDGVTNGGCLRPARLYFDKYRRVNARGKHSTPTMIITQSRAKMKP